MGLTIHWSLRMQGDELDALATLKNVREDFIASVARLPKAARAGVKVGELVYWDAEKTAAIKRRIREGARDSEALMYFSVSHYIDKEEILDEPKRIAFFRVEVMEGCETLIIGLAEFEDGFWASSHFCKTTYAKEPVIAHLIVTRMLELCEEYRILESVSDEGEFWENRSNPKAVLMLKRRFEEDHQLLDQIARSLRKQVGAGNIVAAIDEKFVRDAVNEALKHKQLGGEK